MVDSSCGPAGRKLEVEAAQAVEATVPGGSLVQD